VRESFVAAHSVPPIDCKLGSASVVVCTLFNDAVGSLDYIASNDRIINEQCAGKDLG
jgi:hypothetical protein